MAQKWQKSGTKVAQELRGLAQEFKHLAQELRGWHKKSGKTETDIGNINTMKRTSVNQANVRRSPTISDDLRRMFADVR